MSNINEKTNQTDDPVGPFDDPVGYLAGLGIEAELVEVRSVLPEAA